MKKIININLSSRLIPIEDSAYEILRQYLDSLKKYFANEEGGDEIVSDIESRVAEIFQDKLKKGAHCITDEDVVAVKAAMGTPEQFDDAPKGNTQNEQKDSFEDYIPRPRKRLYRDPDNKVLSGVCSGLGAYFNIDPVIFRIIFALLAIGGFGSGILVYFILWIATPAAETTTEKLEMRGEKVDLNNIKATIQEELSSMKNQMKNVGSDIKNFSQGRGRQVGNDLESFFVNLAKGLGQVLVFVTKGFLYFFAAVMLICLITVGILLAVSSAALMPLKNLLLTSPVQNYFFWPALALVIGIPVVGLLIFIVRKLTGVKQANRYASYALVFLWLLGLVFSMIVITSVVKDFRRRGSDVTQMTITQPSKGKLIVKREPGSLLTNDDDFITWFDDHLMVADDTVIVNFVRVKVEKSKTDSFEVAIVRYSQGRTIQQATELAKGIQFHLNQQDSVLYLPEGITVPVNTPYRGQRVTVIIRVPVGKHIEIDREVYRNHSVNRGSSDDDFEYRDGDYDDNNGPIELKMTPDGSQDTHPHPPVHEKSNRDSSEENYRYKGNDSPAVSLRTGRSSEQQQPVQDIAALFFSHLYLSVCS
ncbi:MAG TPA: PspC domain-containing protein [Chitinophaga sp.]|uniref:PspC domain-containing protein n=1 Tax=Chitinophaga sp. TaxID=1869181 RepID=UPI002B810957|nr:PspC domain-containing protein [Chitinophaga sp.]HVI48307.1 PspC domain-containing protein [Chitinophaga sp.]